MSRHYPVFLSPYVVSTPGHEGMDGCYWTCSPAITIRKPGKLCKTTVSEIGQQAVQNADPQLKKRREGTPVISLAFCLQSGGYHRKGVPIPLSIGQRD